MLTEKPYPQFSLATYYRELGIDFKEIEADDHVEIITNCMKCVENGELRPDTKQRLWANETRGQFCCYNCGWDGGLPWLVAGISNTTLAGALGLMKGKTSSFGVFSFRLAQQEYERDDDDEADELREVAFPHGFESFEECRTKKTIFHRYLDKRGIPLSYAKMMGWGFSTVGYTQSRIIVPTYMDDRLVFWQARDILEKEHPNFGDPALYRKVLNPKGVSKSKVLYNFDVAAKFSTVVIVEGFIDAAKAGPNAMAINGKKLHAAQAEHLTRTKAREIVLCLDPDAFTDQRYHRTGPRAGKLKKPSSVEHAKGLLSIYFKVRTVRLPDGRDAGSYEPSELRQLLGEAVYPSASLAELWAPDAR